MTTDFMVITFVLFLAAAISVPIATRFGLGSVLGYLIAGIAVGPILRTVGADIIALQHFAEFGVVMMLFLIGLEMNPRELWKLRNRIFVLGGLQISLTAGLVMAIAIILGQPWSVSLAIGLVVALSSTAIVNQTLKEKGLLRSKGGQSSFAVLLAQDIAVIPILALVPLLAMPELFEAASSGAGTVGHNDETGLNISLVDGLNGWQTALVTGAAIFGVLLIGIHFVTPLFRFVAPSRSRELLASTALMVLLGVALMMTMVGLSPALGAFLAGVVLAGSEYRHELESNIDPFRGLFLGVFFMTVGAGIDVELLMSSFATIMGLTIGLILLKAAVLFLLAKAFGLNGSDQWLLALGLAQAGEFGFVLLSFTVSNAVIPASVSDTLLLVVALSMLLTPVLFLFYDRFITPRYVTKQTQMADEIMAEAKIIIAGHGRFGGIVNRALVAAGFETTVVDYNSERLDVIRKMGFKAYFGDATRADLLAAAGIAEARLLVVAIDGKDAATRLTEYVCQTYPDVHVITRAHDRSHVYDLWLVGCRDVIHETYDSSVRAARSAFEALGIEQKAADRMMKEFERADRKMILETAELHVLETSLAENEAFIERVSEMQDGWEAELGDRMKAARANTG